MMIPHQHLNTQYPTPNGPPPPLLKPLIPQSTDTARTMKANVESHLTTVFPSHRHKPSLYYISQAVNVNVMW